ncbi:MAG: ABC transporter permease [Ruminococcaceae bacterium]|nr:ABC transporter permease [Oscillospiraceae bacterium]
MIVSFFRSISVLLKKDALLYGKNIVSMLLLLALLITCAAAALSAALTDVQSDASLRLNMAIFDKEPSYIANQAVEIIANTDGVQSMFTVEICNSETEVRNGMKSGIFDAAIVFEEEYFSKILDGDDAGVTILISDKLSAAAETVKHFAHTGEKLIKIAESGIEAAYEKLLEEYPSAKAGEIIRPVEIDYAFKIFALPTEGFDTVTLSYAANGVDTFSHYILCFAAFLLILCEVLFFPYTAKDCEFSMLRRIKSYRINTSAIVLQKAVIPFFIRLVLLCAISAIASAFVEIDITAESVIGAILCALLISIFMSALSVLLSQTSLGISVIFALSIAFLVFAGGLIPSAMLPFEMTLIGAFLPLGLCRDALAPLLCGTASYSIAILAALTAILFALASLYLNRITVKGGGDK